MDQLKLLLCFLITVTLSNADQVIKYNYTVITDQNGTLLNWTWNSAMEQCRANDQEMITLDLVTQSSLKENIPSDLHVLWMGLLRDSENDSAWHWIDIQSGTADSEDLSQSINWADNAQSSHCAYVDSNSSWLSKRCEEKYNFFCSADTDDVRYHLNKLSWHDAREVCQKDKSNLVTITENTKGTSDQSGWIGLYRVGGETWRWAEGQSVSYTAWQQGQPVTYDCGAFDADDQKWHSYPCNTLLNLICYDDNLVVVHENKTWEQALEHCTKLDRSCLGESCVIQNKLLTLESDSDHGYVRERISSATTDEVWTGLRFLGGKWWWVNGDQINDDGKLPQCPVQPSHCGVVSKTDDTLWLTRDCSERLNFVCYEEKIPYNFPV